MKPWLTFFDRAAAGSVALALLPLAACTSTSTIDTAFADLGTPPAETAPASAVSPTSAGGGDRVVGTPPDQAAVAATPAGDVRNTGAYPNINAEPPPATTHITNAERAALLAELQAVNAALDAGRVPPAEAAARITELQRLAATHSDDVLRRIEATE